MFFDFAASNQKMMKATESNANVLLSLEKSIPVPVIF
jgi:hypothetical protein